MQTKVAVIGGDMRAAEAAKILMAEGCTCVFFGNEELPGGKCVGFDERRCSEPYLLREALEGAELVLLPVPVTRDKKMLNAPFSSVRLTIEELFRALPEGCLIVGGGLPAERIRGREGVLDLLSDEEFVKGNALPTAEGAIGLALLHYQDVLQGAHCAVLGYGRIAQSLCGKLCALGAQTTVFARSEEQRKDAEGQGCRALPLHELSCACKRTDIVFNTVPAPVFSADAARALSEESLYIELASSPFGTTEEARDILEGKLLMAPGLPGRYSPRFAGWLIAKRTLSFLSRSKEK